MTRVCHMTSAHNSNDVRIFYKECSSLAKGGYDVYLVARGESREENGVHIVGLGNAPKRRLERMTSFARRVYREALRLDADIYHIHDPELLPYGLKLKRRGKKVIFDSHENYTMQIEEKQYLPMAGRILISKLYYLYESYTIKKYDAVVVPCTFNKKNIFENRAKKTAIIANYQPIIHIDFEEISAKKNGRREMCYAGILSEANGITEAVIAAFDTQTNLVLAGRFTSEEYKNRIFSMPEFAAVDYRGILQYEDVLKMYIHANIGYYVEKPVGQNAVADTFGMKIYEFMALGLPILVDKTTYSKELIDKYSCGIYVQHDSLYEIEQAINELLNNPTHAKEMGKNGRRAVEEEFNWGTQEKILLELYRELL